MKLHADQPIRSLAQDKLERSTFARRLADGIMAVPATNGFVIGLEGQWGAGKTSLIAMITEAICHSEMASLTAKGSYPGDPQSDVWDQAKIANVAKEIHAIDALARYQDKQHTITRFVSDIVAKHAPEERRSDMVRYIHLREYAKLDSQILVVPFSPWLVPTGAALSAAFIRDLSIVLSDRFGWPIASTLQAYVERIAALTPIAEAGASTYGLSGFGAALRSLVGFFLRPKTLDSLKADLESQLRSISPNRVLVIIDDLDRLSPAEATEMIGLVKNLGALPNVVYLLTYDHSVLSRQIHEALKVDGSEYLQKIIQLRRSLPFSKRSKLFSLLMSEIGEVPALFFSGIESYNFTSLWMKLISHYINSPRDVSRLSGSFQFSYASLKNSTDATDLFVLEILNVLDPKLFDWIKKNITNLASGKTFQEGPTSIGMNEDERWQKMRGELGDEWNEARQNVIAFLFPNHASRFSTFAFGSSEDRSHRIRDFQHSLTYFSLNSETVSWPADVLKRLRAAKSVHDMFTEMYAFVEIQPEDERPELRRQFLAYLEGWVPRDRPSIEAWVMALPVATQELITLKDDSGGFTDNIDRLGYLISIMLQSLSEDERASVLLPAIRKAADISLLASFVRRSARWSVGFGRQNGSIRSTLLQRVKSLARSGKLWDQVDTVEIIYFWKQASRGNTVRAFLTKSLQENDVAAMTLLSMWSRASAGEAERIVYSILPTMDEFYDFEAAKEKAQFFVSLGTSEQKEQGQWFLDALQNGQKRDRS